MVDFKNVLRNTLSVAGLLAVLVVFAGSVTAQSRDDRIAERIKPVGEVCLAGEPCAGGAGAVSIIAPALPIAAVEGFSVTQTYTQSCAMCHDTGMAGAPKLGDADVWASRIQDKGMETIIQNAITGINAMPPRGMCMTCTDENIADLVEHLIGDTQ